MKFSAYDCFVKGGAIGLGPDAVRQISLSDLAAAFEGWQLAQGIEPPLKEATIAQIDDLMARYPDKVVH